MNTIQHPPSEESRQKDSLLGVSQRLPPANVQAEQALLGALLTNNRAYDRVSDFLTGAHFADEINGRIYDAISRRIEAGQLADPVTLRAEFENTGVLAAVGGTSYLAKLLTSMVGIINAADYGRVIHDAWIRRQLIDIGQDVVNNAFGARPDLDGPDQIAASEEALFRLATEKGQDGGFLSFDRALADALDIAQQAFNRSGDVVGLTTGLRDLDKKTGGLHPSDLLILAGRPAMGKTALATKIAFSAARSLMEEARNAPEDDKPKGSVAIFSLEMSAEQLATRILSEQASVSGEKIRRGDLGQKEFDRFVQVSRELAQLPLHIDDTPAISLSAMRTRCRRLARTKGLSLVVVDYLQLMRPSVGSRAENRVLEISMITQGLKALAKELSVPVIALSQLSRQVESREDKRPMLSDLRESGSIEQDADAVMFVYRDQYYLQQRQPKETSYDSQDKYQTAMEEWQRKMDLAHNRAELILEKQRHGPTGTVHLFFEGEFTRFADLDMVHDI
ncbi:MULTISPECIES: replicative DNA helicase [Komagataeibacter]|uniref:Replicative DNA helicase n=1 Tax=Komagataeibacter saccharivorans TaxID=265959 RepID=A0A347WE11_9PROT|nr:replicative DNA helicase [Komagataeibacter saccharivorans]AXY23104.1 Replicative DNA helicase [Komagataeibacter saccharivorans]PMP98844.1 DNA helicase [Komagataeibacter saccharivorans]PYD50534.1 replicative DNA helicase [Komagataeibacter saccharivorans]QBL92978.1 Replicative DNA helicase [Komagataeibacter saccharivorans]GBQ36725.1 replicative DNA helicase [Komagataeibacter saccharivorans NRIC 0614]